MSQDFHANALFYSGVSLKESTNIIHVCVSGVSCSCFVILRISTAASFLLGSKRWLVDFSEGLIPFPQKCMVPSYPNLGGLECQLLHSNWRMTPSSRICSIHLGSALRCRCAYGFSKRHQWVGFPNNIFALESVFHQIHGLWMFKVKMYPLYRAHRLLIPTQSSVISLA